MYNKNQFALSSPRNPAFFPRTEAGHWLWEALQLCHQPGGWGVGRGTAGMRPSKQSQVQGSTGWPPLVLVGEVGGREEGCNRAREEF